MSPIHRSVDGHASNPEDGPSDHLGIRGRGCHHYGCGGPKYANAYGSRRRMTPPSRSDPVLRFVGLRQTFVRRSHGRKKAPATWGIRWPGQVKAEWNDISSALSTLLDHAGPNTSEVGPLAIRRFVGLRQ
jgi:hypothetical protein